MSEGRTELGFCSLAPCLGFSKASLSGCRPGWDVCASGPDFFFSPLHPPKTVEMCPDIHRCRSTLQGTGRPSPGYINISSAIRKDPQTLAKKVPKVYTWLPTSPGDYSPFPKVIETKGKTK